MKKGFKLTKKLLLGSLIILICVFTFIASPTSTVKNNTNKVTLSADTWKSNLAEVDKVESQTLTNYLPLKNLVTLDSDDLVISVSDPKDIDANTIIMLNDGLDVYYFSEICNPTFANGAVNPYYKTYLSLSYTLGTDIDYEDASKTFKMLRPIGWREPFSGTFDARGYTISNIFYRPFEDMAEIQDNYPELVYIAWFSQNSGTIKNLGIINANMIQYNLYEPTTFASPFVGNNLNDGTIENCFVQDLRKEEAGLSAEGGYDVSMFVSDNSGTIKNCYVACDRITSSSITITFAANRHPFCNGNTGTLIDCYYDTDTLIAQNQTYVEEAYSGLTGLKTQEFQSDKFNYKDDQGNLEGIWYSNYTYPVTHASYLKLNYPVLKGFNITTIDSHDYFVIENIVDFVYLSELIENYQPFRSSSYILTNSVDLNSVKEGSFVFSQAVFSGILKSGYKTPNGFSLAYSADAIFENNYSITLADGNTSNYNSIINLNINYGNSYNGYNCYGLFSVLSGTIENINIVNTTISLADIDTINEHEINTIGTVCGLLEGGNISNVNIYSDIYLNKDKKATSIFLGSNYVGGICGTATSGVISSCTTNGEINQVTYTTLGTDPHEHSIGGILGKALNNDGVTNCLNNIDISAIEYQTARPNNAYRQYIGGVIGSGEINNTTQLQNNATINVGRDDVTSTYYSQTYVAGIIGKVSNVSGSNGLYLNNADVNYYVNDNNYKAYISGVMNVISETADKYDSFNITINAANVQQELNDQKPFEFTSLSNAGLLNIENNLTNSKSPAKYSVFTNVTNGIDIRSAGICYSYLTNMNVTGGYNLDYHYERENNSLVTKPNEPQNIDISMIDKYAPAFNADNKLYYLNNELHIDTNIIINTNLNAQTVKINTPIIQTSITLKRVYNYNQMNYITKKPVNMFNLQLSGCVNGRNFNLENIRNDGDVNVYFTQATNSIKFANTTYRNYFGADKTLKVYGIFEEVSLNHRAKDIYNGGNITISQNDSAVPNYILYASGIGYKNVGNDKPSSDALLIEKGYVGSLHNCVNNGDIRLTRGDITTNNNITEPGHFYGGVRLSGIVGINSSTISQTFNLGNVYNINEAYQDGNSNYGDFGGSPTLEIETGGFCYVMQNEIYNAAGDTTQANIIDSANNGTIVAMNTGTNQSFTNAGGFVARNDRGEEGELVTDNSVSRNSHTIKIQYSINYGDIYAVNRFYDTMYGGEQQSKAAGFICLGACTVVDVINYGNIYGSEVASGIFGYLFIQRMIDGGMGTNSPIYIANSINYGKAQIVDRTTSNINKICNIDETKVELELLDVNSSWDGNTTNISVAGALIGVWSNGTGNQDLESLNVKYLVNFCDDLDILGWTYNSNYTGVNNLKFRMLENMATTKVDDTSPAPFDTDDQGHEYGIRCYSKDTSTPNPNEEDIYSQDHNGGIFNENYSLRKPGELTYDENGDIDLNNTDNFIADYIQFVPYSKVNDYLVEKIGLQSTVLANTYDNALVNSELIKQVILAKYTGSQITDIYDELIDKYSSSLNQKKNSIAESIVSYLKEHPEYTDELASLLTSDSATFSSILDSSDVQSILTKVIKNLTDEDKDLIIEIFNNLINTNTFETLVDGMPESSKDQILEEIFDLVENDPAVLTAIATKCYEDLNITSEDDLASLRDELLTERLNSNTDLADYPITRNEYQNMYLLTRINSLSNNELNTFLQNIENQLNNTNNAVYRFVESGRQNSSGLYLPASSENYVAYVNSTNYSYIENPSTAGNNQTYTGTALNINGEEIPSNYYELYITNGRIGVQGGWNTAYFGWEVRNNTYTLISGADNNDYIVYYRCGDETGTQAWPANIGNTGVYIDLTNNNPVEVSSGNNWNRVTFEERNLNINNFRILNYIDYGTGATDKNPNNNTNLNQSMITQMRNLVNTNANKVKEYLLQIYANSTADSTAFLNLIPTNNNVANMTVNQLVQNTITNINNYLNGNNKSENLTKAYANAILDNISNNTAKANVVKLLLTDPTDYDAAVGAMIKALDTSNQTHYEDIKKILPLIFNYSFSGVNSTNKVSIANRLITIGKANDLITTSDNILIVKQSIIGNVNCLGTVMSNINDNELYAEVIANLIVGNETDFRNYTGLDENNIITELERLGIDSSIVTDFTGIYALASSLGIEAGLFLPDNIQLIGMDYYYTDEDGNITNDPTWRGGTEEEPNSYSKDDTEKVNYKVYYEMKQLKKSIATIIFEMELTDEDHNIITNNIETDYFSGYKELQDDGSYITRNEVYYYIPINHDILLNDEIFVNTENGSYELSYGATFDNNNELRITNPGVDQLNVGDTLMDTFIVQAEDVTVKTTYTVIITITESSYLNFDLDSGNATNINLALNGTNTTVTSDSKDIYEGINVVTDIASNSAVQGYNGVIRVNLATFNMMNKLNMLNNVKVYKQNTDASDKVYNGNNFEELVLNKDYKFNDVQNNGIVVIAGESGTGYNPNTNSYNSGLLFFDLSISNDQSKGLYLIEIILNSEYSYYVLIEKAASIYANLESITYNNQEYDNNNTNSNEDDPATHAYGTTISEAELLDGSYLDKIVISPLSTYEITSAIVTNNNDVKEYIITYLVTAEDGETKFEFNHYITEEENATYINNIFQNGGVLEEGPIEKDPDEDYIFSTSFEKEETPSYRFEYHLAEFYYEADSNFFKVIAYDENNQEIPDDVLAQYMNVFANEGYGFEIHFLEEALSVVYYFEFVYENSFDFNGTTKLEWHEVFDRIEIQKLKSRNSYLDNATFLSESVVSSIRTMIDVDEITLDEYKEMLVSPTRKIVCLPGQIHYNEYSYSYNKDTKTVTKENDFYVIGLVNKTQLDWYTPTFTLPDGAKIYRTTTIDDEVYRYVPYYVDELNDITTFLVNEDGSVFKTEDSTTIDAVGDEQSFTYDGTTYNISPVAGLQTIDYNGTTIVNTTLYTNYTENGSFKEGPNGEEDGYFEYVHYRVYAEIYGDQSVQDNLSDYYTDYFIATQDLTNNIRFNIIIDKAAGCDINTKVLNVYAEFVCYQLIGSTENTAVRDENYELYNRAGLFGYFTNENVEDVVLAEHVTLQSNTSGWYSIYIALPDGYTFTYRFEDKGASKVYTEGEECYVENSITARTITLHITIDNDNIFSNDDWGVNVKDESFIKNND